MHDNATGFTPAESKALSERQANEGGQRIVKSLKEMYSCSPNSTLTPNTLNWLPLMVIWQSTFDVYNQDAVFHNPVGIAEGVQSICNQFAMLTKSRRLSP